ncbi:MAG: pilin [Candidatus Komeilibacteria bacterium]|nr:pilin [Candidatus Komeilibacteria bacterium]
MSSFFSFRHSYWFIASLGFILTFPTKILAAIPENLKNKLNTFSSEAGYGAVAEADYSTSGLAGKIGSMVKILLAFLGIVFLILIIISGFKWMTTNNPEEIKKLRSRIVNAVIGLVIILASYAITYYILTSLIPTDLAPGLQTVQ